jgi:hypothetical protein
MSRSAANQAGRNHACMNKQFESGLVAAFLVFAWSRPSKTASFLTVLIGLLGLAFYCGPPLNGYCDVPAGVFARFIQVLVYCGCAAIVTTPFVPLFHWRTTGYASMALFRDMLIPPLGALASAISINSLDHIGRVTYDQFLFLWRRKAWKTVRGRWWNRRPLRRICRKSFLPQRNA